MRLWHESLIPHLSRQHLLGQHRECCAMRGGGWGKKHATVDYAYKYNPYKLYQYHVLVMDEMRRRTYKPTEIWYNIFYRGTKTESWNNEDIEITPLVNPIFPEHNNAYLKECIDLLCTKGYPIKI